MCFDTQVLWKIPIHWKKKHLTHYKPLKQQQMKNFTKTFSGHCFKQFYRTFWTKLHGVGLFGHFVWLFGWLVGCGLFCFWFAGTRAVIWKQSLKTVTNYKEGWKLIIQKNPPTFGRVNSEDFVCFLKPLSFVLMVSFFNSPWFPQQKQQPGTNFNNTLVLQLRT